MNSEFIFFVIFLSDPSSYCSATSGCRLPTGPSGHLFCDAQRCGRCAEGGPTCHLAAGADFAGAVVRVQCAVGRRLADDREYAWLTCNRTEWIGELPDCLDRCPALETHTVVPRCVYNGREVDCRRPAMPSTTATANCRPTYSKYPGLESEGVYGTEIRCLYNGMWSASLPECKPDCGRSKGSAIVVPTVAAGGLSTPLGVFPWHAGLYQKDGQGWRYFCGGSLISKEVVVTAAHCIPLATLDQLRVTFAKIYQDWNRDEKDTIKRNVSDVSIPREFSHAVTTLLWDIALLLLSEPVQFNSFVMPVCMTDRLPLVDPTHPLTAYLVGWGQTEADGENSEILLHNNVSLEWESRCRRLDISKLVIFDKFCALKNSTSVVENGDSGGGLTVEFQNQHYLLGVVSLKYNNISVFTNVTWSTHVDWRIKEIKRFEENLSRCPRRGFACASTGRCVSASARCDGYRHCPDGSDEEGCPKHPEPTPAATDLPPHLGNSTVPDDLQPVPTVPTTPKRMRKVFIVFTELVSWHEAERRCTANDTQLAVVSDRAENEQLSRSLRSSFVSSAWIGANDLVLEKRFAWSADGAPVGGFAPWGQDEPDSPFGGQHCVSTSCCGQHTRWHTEHCERETYFVCQAYRPA